MILLSRWLSAWNLGSCWAALCLAPAPFLSEANGDRFELESVELPPLRDERGPIRAHTQGLEIVGDSIWVTARRDDPGPRRPLLLRASPAATRWEIWDLGLDQHPELDHPGGFQSDGSRFWIPLAESRRQGRSLIRAYRISDLRPGQAPTPAIEFAVRDHIGAVAVMGDQSKIIGAAWDTDTVFVWTAGGELLETMTGRDLRRRGLGAGMTVEGAGGLAVQDWKFVDGSLVASGLIKAEKAGRARSQVLCLDARLEPRLTLPPLPDEPAAVPLGREGMAVANGFICFLPEDLGAANRLRRMAWGPFRDAARRRD